MSSGDQSVVEPPGPIPNPEVKRRSADGSWTIGPARVGRRQVYARPQQTLGPGSFFAPASAGIPSTRRILPTHLRNDRRAAKDAKWRKVTQRGMGDRGTFLLGFAFLYALYVLYGEVLAVTFLATPGRVPMSTRAVSVRPVEDQDSSPRSEAACGRNARSVAALLCR